MASSTSFPSCLVPPALPWKRAARQFPATRAKKEEAEGGGTKAEENTTSAFSLSAAASTLARPAVAAFGLGFLDAGNYRCFLWKWNQVQWRLVSHWSNLKGDRGVLEDSSLFCCPILFLADIFHI
ncbi:uncharacterized protein LOC122004106 isoform X3 [Zingiber officinale]|uniref:uncharacterized protein LOC122004106 isoform X3 n=1 Tax=Zingiber officinale TaxID=94328 RepID=UPI001C4D5129|nr:uncharacterized protein LOC122004106 isoform X3 [Zingiber officinale]